MGRSLSHRATERLNLSHAVLRVVLVYACTVLMATTAAANSFSFIGTFQQDSDVSLFNFTLGASSIVMLDTKSYGGGTDAVGAVIPSGGFETVLSLFSGSGTFITDTTVGSCPPGNIDATTGLCGDASLNQLLGAGNYTVALTEYFNVPNGLTLSAGFLEDGAGNFTGPVLCGMPGSFLDFGCNQRNGNFAVDISGSAVTSAVAVTAVPEPGSLILTLFGIVSLALAKKFFGRGLLQHP